MKNITRVDMHISLLLSNCIYGLVVKSERPVGATSVIISKLTLNLQAKHTMSNRHLFLYVKHRPPFRLLDLIGFLLLYSIWNKLGGVVLHKHSAQLHGRTMTGLETDTTETQNITTLELYTHCTRAQNSNTVWWGGGCHSAALCALCCVKLCVTEDRGFVPPHRSAKCDE